MTSSRDTPFSFSPDLRTVLGPPDTLNTAVRSAFPELFDRDYGPTRAAAPFVSERVGAGVAIRPGASIPAGTLVGLFTGHLFDGDGRGGVGARVIALPIFQAHGADLRLVVDGEARSSRFPSAVEAALYGHSCTAPTVHGSWWMEGPVPCLTARTTRALSQIDRLAWDFDSLSTRSYTSSHAEARAWRRAGHRTRRCTCNAPRDCPRDRFVCLADEPDSAEDSD